MSRPVWRRWTDWLRRHWRGPAPMDLDLSGEWVGTYRYPGSMSQIPFVVTWTDRDAQISGQCEEINTFGDPSVSHLFALLEGIRDGWQVNWLKTYDGRGGASHSLLYEGWIERSGRAIQGRWTGGMEPGFIEWSSTFEMVRQDVANER